MHVDEREWVNRITSGDAAALHALIDSFHPSMTRLARSIIGDPTHVEDVVQDAWMGVLAALPRFEPRAPLKSWVLQIVANRARSHLLRLGKREELGWMEAPEPEGEGAVAPDRFNVIGRWRAPLKEWNPESALLQKEVMTLIKRELERLPGGQGAVVALRDVEGLSSKEVCDVLGITEANQRVLLHRGRSRLRSAIERALEGGAS